MKIASILLLSMVLAIGGCTPASAPPSIEVGPNESSALQVILVSADFAVGAPRISFALFDGPDAATGIKSVTVNAIPLDDDLSATDSPPVWSGTAENYTDFEVPYWVFYPELDEPGYWGMVAEIEKEDGSTSRADFLIELVPESASVPIGAAAPPSDNLTLTTQPDIALLSSASDPDPALYQMTIAEAIASGKPTVVGFLTPGFCQTKFCAPVLQSMESLHNEVGDGVNFIHVEVYNDFQALTVVPEMAEWGLESEPWVFVLDGDGNVVDKFSGPVSPREIRTALDPLMS